MKKLILVLILTVMWGGKAEAALVGYWNFNEGLGDVAHDSSGLGNDGTGLDSNWVAGKYGYGTTSDQITVPYDPALLPATGLTISAWVKIDEMNGLQRRIVEMDYRYGLLFNPLDNNSQTPFLFAINSNNYGLEFQDVAIGEWVHAAVSWDGNMAQFYFNGSPAAPVGVSDSISQVGGVPLFMGRQGYTLDEVRIYNTALSREEILSDMNFDSAAPAIPEPAAMLLFGSGMAAFIWKKKFHRG